MAAGKNCHARLNKLSFYFLIAYVITSMFYCAFKQAFNIQILSAFISGCFIFITLHHIYFMAFIGLAKKSVSVNILEDIERLNGTDENYLISQYAQKTEAIRLNRLEQMKFLKMATEKDNIYTITKQGIFINKLGNFILNLWGLRRL